VARPYPRVVVPAQAARVEKVKAAASAHVLLISLQHMGARELKLTKKDALLKEQKSEGVAYGSEYRLI